MKVSYYSLGCKVNEYESIAVINDFVEHGFELVPFTDEADVYIINTCTVTAVSDAKSRKAIRQAVKRNPQAVVAVMGCFSQLNPDLVHKIEGVDIVIGTSNRHLLYGLVEDVLRNKNPRYEVNDIRNVREYEEIRVKRFSNHTRGFVKIEDGCDNFCAYCTIPIARGRVRSRKPEDVIREIRDLADQGMKEIVLAGISTGAYGSDLTDYSFSNLLRDLVKSVENLPHIRISSIEVTELSPELMQVLQENREHFCHHFHIPLQGGTDSILKRMNRRYDTAFYREKVQELRAIFPDVNITTDYMTGFPGETQEEFQKGLAFLDTLSFGEMHIFPYSKRPNTRAYHFPDQVDEITKHFRVNELLEFNKRKALEYRKQFAGQVVEVLVEKNHEGIAYGHTSNYLEVEFLSLSAKQNDLAYVILTKPNYPVSKGDEVKSV